MQRSHKANKQNSEVLTRLNYCDLIWIRLTIRHNMAGREGRLNRIFRVGLLVLKKVKEYPYKKNMKHSVTHDQQIVFVFLPLFPDPYVFVT